MDKANMEWAKDIPCRNVIIYGYCRKEREGCPFKHEDSETESGSGIKTVVGSQAEVAPPPKFNAKVSASFTPMSAKNGSVAAVTIESRTPAAATTHLPSLASGTSFTPPAFNPYAAETFTPSSSAGTNLNQLAIDESDSRLGVRHAEGSLPVSATGIELDNMAGNAGGTSPPLKYPTIYPPPHSLLQYHLYAPDPPPHLKVPLKPNEQTPESLFIPNDLREELVKRNLASLQVFPLGGATPTIVQDYFGLVPLDFNKSTGKKDSFQGHKNSLYKVFSNLDGKVYLLRRIHAVSITDPAQISSTFQAWSKVASANVVKLVDLFLTTKFGDSSLCAVYDYYPLASSLYDTHFTCFPLVPITQELLWTYLVQLTNAIRAIHASGLAVINLDWDKVIVSGSPGRVKISGCGAVDVLRGQEPFDLLAEQQRDFIKLGTLLKDLASKMSSKKDSSVQDLVVDDDFKSVLQYLLNQDNSKKNIQQLTSLFQDRIFDVINSSLTYTEYTEGVLSKELENGRLFRLMCKLNCVYGRMESRIDVNWSESGTKFPITLFYDYVFHQIDTSGKNVLDLTHVLRCLNKLDAGVSEKIVLTTPDEMNCIMISYKELRDLIDSTFRSLTQ
ncbi:hypothetical protein HG537_0D06520 [Torulaspora globosa]|uniref:PAN2-PAN3 deadenylation complex subunit PAN3 n=1 Tax=Torulaspora globosa TaxID=48254 RepID=A0A7H9HTI8_9SACH|nr:hypothetical protein HG537_0D06520 [Torulaspora sp. CBS 2947]